MKKILLLILISIIVCTITYSQEEINLKKLQKAYCKKYLKKKGSYCSFIRESKREGHEMQIDTMDIYWAKKKEDIMIYFRVDDNEHLIFNDSVFNRYNKSAEYLKYQFTKINEGWLQSNNEGNPYYFSSLFFGDLRNCEVANEDYLESTYLKLKYDEENKYGIIRKEYVLNLQDTSIVSYKISSQPNISVGESITLYTYQTPDKSKIQNNIKQYFHNVDFELYKGENRYYPYEIGDTLPNFDYVNLQGDTIKIGTDKKLVLLDYWYIGCGPCALASKDMNKIVEQYPQLKVVGINAYQKKVAEVKDYVEKSGLKYEVLLNLDHPIKFSYPTFVLMDSDFCVKLVLKGYSKKNMKLLYDYLNSEFGMDKDN